MVFWPSGFLEAWGTKAKKPHAFMEMCVCVALVPQASKKTLGQKTLRDPFDYRYLKT